MTILEAIKFMLLVVFLAAISFVVAFLIPSLL